MTDILDYLNELEIFDELAPIICISFIGSCIHEYIFKTEQHHRFFFNLNIWISTLVSSIISFTIDPWILDFNSRLIFLPPLIIGLSGMDLINKLTTLKGSAKILEFLVGFIGLKRKDSKDDLLDDDKKEEKKKLFEEYKTLENLLSNFFNLSTKLISDYYTTKDMKYFISTYLFIKQDFDIIRTELLHYNTLPINLVLILTSIYQKIIELDTLYNKISRSIP